MSKQDIIENKIDELSKTEMGKALTACIALCARACISNCMNKNTMKANRFISEFSEELGFKNHTDTAFRVLKYMYPQNCKIDGTWKRYDEMYLKMVKDSAWLGIIKAQEQGM